MIGVLIVRHECRVYFVEEASRAERSSLHGYVIGHNHAVPLSLRSTNVRSLDIEFGAVIIVGLVRMSDAAHVVAPVEQVFQLAQRNAAADSKVGCAIRYPG